MEVWGLAVVLHGDASHDWVAFHDLGGSAEHVFLFVM